MKIKHQLSLATLLMAGVFVTGCSQQTAGGSQVSGSSQAAGSQQVSGSQSQVEPEAVVAATPAAAPAKTVTMAPKAAPKAVNRWGHTHPAIPRCTDSIRHTHKYNAANHTHKYSCKGAMTAKQPVVDVYALQRKLAAKGYYKGAIDGIVGPATRSALQRFMKR